MEDLRNILVIDDDATVRKLMKFHLKKRDYNVLEVEAADQALEVLNQNNIDLVLCDVGMEGTDGFAFCKKVREIEKYKVLPFIFVTAMSSLEDKEKALSVGGDDIITKPFDVNELGLKIQALLRRSDIYKQYGAKKQFEKAISEDTPKIVLVDDDASLAKLFQYNLTKAGFECFTANNANDGLELVKKVLPDIIISDIMMPKVDGFQFRKNLLAEPEVKGIPFMFLTSKGGEEDILDGYDLGIADYVLKTAGPRVVVAKVSAMIKSLGKERQKVVSELHKAADSLRVKVVPDTFPTFANFEVKHWHLPYQGIPGGDFIDYFPLNGENLAIVLGDVMGKRWGAWYFAIAYAGYVRSAIRVALENTTEYNPKDILQQVNKSIYQDAKISEVFATLSIVIVNNKNFTAKYSGAGDLPIIYFNKAKREASLVQSRGMLLGFSQDGAFEDLVVQLSPGDSLCLVSDGIIESRNSEGIALGSANFAKLVETLPDSDNVMDFLKTEMIKYTNNRFEDDTSLITITVANT